MRDGYGYGGPMMGHEGFGLIGFIGHALILLALVCFVIWLFRRRGPNGRHMWEMWESRSALQILNERYARGEINKDEFEERRKTLLSK